MVNSRNTYYTHQTHNVYCVLTLSNFILAALETQNVEQGKAFLFSPKKTGYLNQLAPCAHLEQFQGPKINEQAKLDVS